MSEAAPRQHFFWYYFETEYPDEGSVFPFRTRDEAEKHAGEAGEADRTFATREATDDEAQMIEFGRTQLLDEAQVLVTTALRERNEAYHRETQMEKRALEAERIIAILVNRLGGRVRVTVAELVAIAKRLRSIKMEGGLVITTEEKDDE